MKQDSNKGFEVLNESQVNTGGSQLKYTGGITQIAHTYTHTNTTYKYCKRTYLTDFKKAPLTV